MALRIAHVPVLFFGNQVLPIENFQQIGDCKFALIDMKNRRLSSFLSGAGYRGNMAPLSNIVNHLKYLRVQASLPPPPGGGEQIGLGR